MRSTVRNLFAVAALLVCVDSLFETIEQSVTGFTAW